MLNAFRLIGLLEGLSFITLLSLVWVFQSREYIWPVGMTHGILFLTYFTVSLMVSHKQGWSIQLWLTVLLSSVIPFAFIPQDLWLSSCEENDEVPEAA